MVPLKSVLFLIAVAITPYADPGIMVVSTSTLEWEGCPGGLGLTLGAPLPYIHGTSIGHTTV